MPRLVGKKSNPALYVGLGLLVAAIGAVGLEYFGVINYVSGFGKETTVDGTIRTPSQINRTVN
jgi:hypothetical protein